MIKIVIYCMNRLFTEGLMKILAGENGVIATGLSNPKSALREIETTKPDIILTDTETFFDFFKSVSHYEKKKILLIQNNEQSFSENDWFMDILISNGVAGILPPETDSSVLKKAIRSIHKGELWLSHKSVKEIIHRNNHKKSLTRQESEIAYYICKGYRNKEIARELNISEQTVKSHCNKIYKKLGISDRLQLALMMLKQGKGEGSK